MRYRLLVIVLMMLLGGQARPALGGDGTDTRLTGSEKVRGYLWHDRDCDGLRTPADGPLDGNPRGFQQLSLFYIGEDGVPFTPDDSEVDVTGTNNGFDEFLFFVGGGGNTYFIAIRPADRPRGYTPAPYQIGTDQTIDNDLRLWPDGTWASSTFVIPAGLDMPPVTGIDLGLCQVTYAYHVHLPLIRR